MKILIALFAAVAVYAADAPKTSKQTPAIRIEKGIEKLIMPGSMRKALQKFNPDFKPWETTDFTKTVREAKRLPGTEATFALILELNGDGNKDMIIAGRDKNNFLIIGLVSEGKGYRAILASKRVLVDPQTWDHMNDGRAEKGLNFYLKGSATQPTFTLAFPQETNVSGDFVAEGGTTNFAYRDNTIVEETPVPL